MLDGPNMVYVDRIRNQAIVGVVLASGLASLLIAPPSVRCSLPTCRLVILKYLLRQHEFRPYTSSTMIDPVGLLLGTLQDPGKRICGLRRRTCSGVEGRGRPYTQQQQEGGCSTQCFGLRGHDQRREARTGDYSGSYDYCPPNLSCPGLSL